MKKALLILAALTAFSLAAQAQATPSAATAKNRTYVDACDLTLIGKILPETSNPYHRVDTMVFKGFTERENYLVRCASGLAVTFRTDSKNIYIYQEWGEIYNSESTMGRASHGYDLYIKDEKGQWRWASNTSDTKKNELTLISNMDGTMHECLVYLPLYSEINVSKIGVDDGSIIEPGAEPFRHRIAIFGSSYTHGVSSNRSGMTYPAIFTRDTGLQMLSLGVSGNSKLQPHFADVLIAADVDAYVFDAFSNPDAKMIKERLFPFIEKIQAAKPGVPLIFQQTIYREGRKFNTVAEAKEAAKMAMADSLMKIAVKKYKDVYYIIPNPVAPDHEESVDGVHPSAYGYQRWARSIEKPILKILRKYGIK